MDKFWTLVIKDSGIVKMWLSNDNVKQLLESGHVTNIYRTTYEQFAYIQDGCVYWKDVNKEEFKEKT